MSCSDFLSEESIDSEQLNEEELVKMISQANDDECEISPQIEQSSERKDSERAFHTPSGVKRGA